MPQAPAAKRGSKQPWKQPEAINPDPVAPTRASRSTAAKAQAVQPAPAPHIFPMQKQLQASRNSLSQSPGEVFDEVSSGSDSDLDDQPTTPTPATTRPRVPILVSPIKARQKRAADNIKKMSDDEVWDMTDEEIIGMFITYKLCVISNKYDLLKRCGLYKSFFTGL